MDLNPDKKPGILQWAESDRPREKLRDQGRKALSDAELLGILIATGNRNETAVDLGKRLLSKAGNDLNQLAKMKLNEMCQVPGIGPAKALTIMAALELGRRRPEANVPFRQTQLRSSTEIYHYIRPVLLDEEVEQFWVILLNHSLVPLRKIKIAEGGISNVMVDQRRIFHEALQVLSSQIVLVHNHPSGKLEPSPEDKRMTSSIVQSGEFLQIRVLDHLIVSNQGFFSFLDQGLL